MTRTNFDKAKCILAKIDKVEEAIYFLTGSEYKRMCLYGDPGDGVTDYMFDLDKEAMSVIRNYYIDQKEKLVKEFEAL